MMRLSHLRGGTAHEQETQTESEQQCIRPVKGQKKE